MSIPESPTSFDIIYSAALPNPRGNDIFFTYSLPVDERTYVSSISQELIGRSYYLFARLAV